MCRTALQGILGGVANQAFFVAHLFHHIVADVNTGGTANALILQAMPDVDACRTNLYAQGAVDTVSQTESSMVCSPLA